MVYSVGVSTEGTRPVDVGGEVVGDACGGEAPTDCSSETEPQGLKEAINCLFHGEFITGDVRHSSVAINGGVYIYFLS